MKRATIKILKIIGGILCIILGIIGLFLPILQGVLLIVLGLVLLGIIEKDDIKKWVKKLSRK